MALPVLAAEKGARCCDSNCEECNPRQQVNRRKILEAFGIGIFLAAGAVGSRVPGLTQPAPANAVPASPTKPAAPKSKGTAPASSGLITGQPGLPGRVKAYPTPRAYTGGATGCTRPDPTSDGCLTGMTAHALAELGRVFGGFRHGPVIKSASAWDEHAWNPSSDHPKGKAIDLFFGPYGVRATGQAGMRGWAVAAWLRQNAERLGVDYVIWQGRIWTGHSDQGGWGRPYGGGGVYDPQDVTGGHYDHIHVSFKE